MCVWVYIVYDWTARESCHIHSALAKALDVSLMFPLKSYWTLWLLTFIISALMSYTSPSSLWNPMDASIEWFNRLWNCVSLHDFVAETKDCGKAHLVYLLCLSESHQGQINWLQRVRLQLTLLYHKWSKSWKHTLSDMDRQFSNGTMLGLLFLCYNGQIKSETTQTIKTAVICWPCFHQK